MLLMAHRLPAHCAVAAAAETALGPPPPGTWGDILSFVPLFKDIFLHVFYWEVPWALFPPL